MRRRPRPAALETIAEPVEPAADPLDTMAERQSEDRLNRAMAGLPERQRAAIALIYGNGASNAEAAETLGISHGALEQLLVRAKRTLRERLKEEVI
jgi:RNA polymerase sigma-70 factor, ECF subfamily